MQDLSFKDGADKLDALATKLARISPDTNLNLHWSDVEMLRGLAADLRAHHRILVNREEADKRIREILSPKAAING